jgi:hypothetical protein
VYFLYREVIFQHYLLRFPRFLIVSTICKRFLENQKTLFLVSKMFTLGKKFVLDNELALFLKIIRVLPLKDFHPIKI